MGSYPLPDPKKGGQNPPNDSEERPAPPKGTGRDAVCKSCDNTGTNIQGLDCACQLSPEWSKTVHELRMENARLRKGLLRIFDRCADWSSADVKAGVADALQTTAKELEIRP